MGGWMEHGKTHSLPIPPSLPLLTALFPRPHYLHSPEVRPLSREGGEEGETKGREGEGEGGRERAKVREEEGE